MGELWDNVFSRSHHDNFCASKGHKNYNVTDCLQAKTFTKEVIIQHFLINLAIAFQASKLIDHPIDDILAKLQKRGCFLSWRVVLLCTRSSRLFSAAAAEHWETRIHEEFQQQERRNCRSWITELFHYLLRAGAIKCCCTFKNVLCMEIETLEMMKEGSRTLSAFQKPWILDLSSHCIYSDWTCWPE